MTTRTFEMVMEKQFNICRNLLILKNQEYSGLEDERFHSFLVAAALQHETPKQALAGMMAKHTVSIYDMCNGGEYSLEKWDEKITDSINYLLLLKALVEEEKGVKYEQN